MLVSLCIFQSIFYVVHTNQILLSHFILTIFRLYWHFEWNFCESHRFFMWCIFVVILPMWLYLSVQYALENCFIGNIFENKMIFNSKKLLLLFVFVMYNFFFFVECSTSKRQLWLLAYFWFHCHFNLHVLLCILVNWNNKIQICLNPEFSVSIFDCQVKCCCNFLSKIHNAIC